MTNTRPGACARALLASTALATLAVPAWAQGVHDAALTFDAAAFETLSVSVDGAPVAVRRYEVVYVAQPIAMAPVQPSRGIPPNGAPDTGEGRPLEDPLAFQKMVVYVPEAAAEDDSSAIILHVRNGGWFASPVEEQIEAGGEYSASSDDDPIGKALSEGHVIVSAGTGVDKTWGSCRAFSVCDGQPTIENCGPCDGYSVSPFGRPPHPSALSHAGICNVID